MNKSFILFISLCLLLSLNVKGQFLKNLLATKYVKGYAVLNNGDTLKGEIAFNDDYADYQYLRLRDTVSKEKTSLHPQDVRFISIDTMHFYPKKLKRDSVFMHLLKNDSLKIYRYQYMMTIGNSNITETSFIYEKPDGTNLQVTSKMMFPFKKRVGEFFSDCPELSEKILNKTYKFDDLYLIADEYNTWLRRKKEL